MMTMIMKDLVGANVAAVRHDILKFSVQELDALGKSLPHPFTCVRPLRH